MALVLWKMDGDGGSRYAEQRMGTLTAIPLPYLVFLQTHNTQDHVVSK